jgi:hypothetical protein
MRARPLVIPTAVSGHAGLSNAAHLSLNKLIEQWSSCHFKQRRKHIAPRHRAGAGFCSMLKAPSFLKIKAVRTLPRIPRGARPAPSRDPVEGT